MKRSLIGPVVAVSVFLLGLMLSWPSLTKAQNHVVSRPRFKKMPPTHRLRGSSISTS